MSRKIAILSMILYLYMGLSAMDGMAASSLSIVKTVSTTGHLEGSPGSSSNFKIEVTNKGNSPIVAVDVIDLLPKGLTYTGCNINPASIIPNSNGSTTIIWNIGSLSVGGIEKIYPRCIRDAMAFGSLYNRVTATGRDQAGLTVTNSSLCKVTGLKPNLRIIDAASVSSCAPCCEVTFTINLQNAGNDTFSTVRISDLLPKGLSYISGSATPLPDSTAIYANGTTNLTWQNLGYIGIGSSKAITLKARIDEGASGPLNDRIYAAARPPKDANHVDNTSSTTVLALRSGVEASTTASILSGAPGTDITFIVDILNNGETPLSLTNVTDRLPQGLSYLSSVPAGDLSGRTIKWANLGSLPPGGSTSAQLKARIDGQMYGTLPNQVFITARPPAGCNVTDNNVVEVTAQKAGVQIKHVPTPESGVPGSVIDFKIDVTNDGQVNLNAIKLIDLLPKGLQYSSASIAPTDHWVEANGTTTIVWNNILQSPLAPGMTASINLMARIDGKSSGTLQNSITAIGSPPAGFDVSAREGKTVTGYRSALQTRGTLAPSQGYPKTNVDLNIEVTNAGDLTINALSLVDLLPKGLSFLSASIDPNGISTNTNGSCTITWTNILKSPLKPESSISFQLKALIDGSTFGELQNVVTATGSSDIGGGIEASDLSTVKALEPTILVSAGAKPVFGPAGTRIVFDINITNPNDQIMRLVNITDTLPIGLSYISSNPPGSVEGSNVTWSGIGDLAPKSSIHINLTSEIDGSRLGVLTNRIAVTSESPAGFRATGKAGLEVIAQTSMLSVDMTADPDVVEPGTNITFSIISRNQGESNFTGLEVVDTMPKGLIYIDGFVDKAPWHRPDSVTSDTQGSTTIIWSNVTSLRRSESCSITVIGQIDAIAPDSLINRAAAIASQKGEKKVMDSANIEVRNKSPVSVSKKASSKVVSRGDEITYTIRIDNFGGFPLNNVLVRDVFNSNVEFISASPMPDGDGLWHFDAIAPNSYATIILTVRVPLTEINFDAYQSVYGDGFMSVTNQYSTADQQFILTNQVFVVADGSQSSANESVTISSAPGTELKVREHGSGSYSSAGALLLHTANRSIEVHKTLSARYQPTSFAPRGKTLAKITSKWSDITRIRNLITCTSAAESYRYAEKVEHQSRIKLDRNGTEMSVDADFKGSSAIEFESGSDFKSSVHYDGSFSIQQQTEQYGRDIQVAKSVAGIGRVNSDTLINNSQRTYESGTGDYQIEELIDSPVSFISKKVNLTLCPIPYDYLPGINITGSLRWKEGIWSKASNLGYIGERFDDIQRLRKETTAAGLNQMATAADFSGRAKFGAISARNFRLDQEQAGEFTIKRKLVQMGVSRYDRPNISLATEGRSMRDRINGINVTVVLYRINLRNDGNVALGPVRVRDTLPHGTQFINSTIKPEKIEPGRINWTLKHLGIGSSITIRFNLTADDGSNLVNRVEAEGGYGGRWVIASNISSIEWSWLE